MSRCISREGEYDDHELAEKPEFMCSRCFAFDEDAAVAEVERLRAMTRRPVTEAEVEAGARALFEGDGEPGYTWAEMLVEEPDRPGLWRGDARRVLEAARRVAHESHDSEEADRG